MRETLCYGLDKMPLKILMIADPAATYLAGLSRAPQDVQIVVSNQPSELAEHAADADAVVNAFHDPGLLAAVLNASPKVRWIHSMWTGVETMLLPELVAHPAPLTNGRGVFREALADWTVAVMLHFSFDFPRVLRQQAAGVWGPFVAESLRGKTLGIVGYGGIGSAAAQRARAFGVRTAALRRRPELFEQSSLVDDTFLPAQLNDLIAASDYLLLSTPLTAETKGMIGAAQIAALKPTAVLINVGRGPVVDENALIAALAAGRIRGAALDVFEQEPLPAGHPFYTLPNVFLSPHTADRVEDFPGPALSAFLENLDRFRKGDALMNLVDRHAGY